MEQASLVLRLRLPSGQATISIAADASFGALLGQVAESTGAPAEALTLSSGFPPQALALEGDSPISSVLRNMDTITVAVAVAAPARAPAKRGGRGRGAASSSARGAVGRGSPTAAAGGGVVTLADVSSGSGSAARKRPAAASGGSGASSKGGSGGGKRRAVGALQLGSEEGIGASLLGAVGSKKGGAALHGEDPAAAFLRAAASSALAHHVEEVHANERFQAALALASGGSGCEFIESDVGRRLDGAATQCDVRFKVGRATRVETFALLSRPELRAVLRTVLEQLGGAGGEGNEDENERPTSLELLKPFKMAHASPRMFWNLAREFGGDVARGLHELLPQQDWSFLEERSKQRSSKAKANERLAAQEAAAKAERAAKRQAKAPVPAEAEGADAGEAPGGEARAEEAEEAEEAEAEAEEAEEEAEEAEEEAEPAADDADGWEERGKRAMLHEREYDYACVCLDRALELRISQAGGRELAEHDAALAPSWYLHGSALLRRAQALAHTLMEATATAAAKGVPDGPATEWQAAAAQAQAQALAALPPEWQTTGSAAIGRRVRRFFALHGKADGTVIAWEPPSTTPIEGGHAGAADAAPASDAAEEVEEALYRIAMDDGDVEDLDDEELDDALKAHSEGRTVAAEVDESSFI